MLCHKSIALFRLRVFGTVCTKIYFLYDIHFHDIHDTHPDSQQSTILDKLVCHTFINHFNFHIYSYIIRYDLRVYVHTNFRTYVIRNVTDLLIISQFRMLKNIELIAAAM